MPVLTEAQKAGILKAANLSDEDLAKCMAINCSLPVDMQTPSGKGSRPSCPVTYNVKFSEAQFILNTNLDPALEEYQTGLQAMSKAGITTDVRKKIPPACHRKPFVWFSTSS